MPDNANELMEKLTALCKRRGFIFPSSEIYGGIGGFWDYGPLGVELKRNIKDAWWNDVVRRRDDMVGLDCSIIMNPKVWEASGHIGGFSDPMMTCKSCKKLFRADHLYMVPWVKAEAIQQLSPEYAEADQELEERLLQIQQGNMSDMERGKARTEAQRLARYRKDVAVYRLVPFWKFVVASTEQEALQSAQLSNKEAKAFHGDAKQLPPKLIGEYMASEVEMRVPVCCPNCGEADSLTPPRQFNLMFKSHAGAMEDSASVVYLRPETAQGIFCNYKNVLDTQRIKVPFGIAQVGKSFRNEINPRNFTFRSREFEQMEIEFFCRPSEADTWYEYWRNERYQWYIRHGLRSSRLRLRDHQKDELAHYARACADVEYEFPFGISELEGIANRTDYDLTQHQKFSGKDLTYFDDEAWEADKDKFNPDKFGGDVKAAKEAADAAKKGLPYRFIPYVIEPSGGCDRAALAFLCEAYCEDEAPDENGKMQTRVVMKLHPRLAPIKAAVFPLVKKEGMPEIATKIYKELQNSGITAFYDEKGAVGRRYRRQDEAGTPFCITVDGQTLQDSTVTIRDRDSLVQERIGVSQVLDYVRQRVV
ncbi:MAG: glycine--tRNA ligase [Planctomycetota bacterium]|nr:glycine--tRNA ligase [Planctomycetota bacterium]